MPASSTLTQTDVETPVADQVRQLRKALASLEEVPGLSVYVQTAQGTQMLIGVRREGFEEGISVPLEGGGRLLIYDSNPGKTALTLARAVVEKTLSLLEMSKREESLLEELSASWESLEALYEISTDVLRSNDINETLMRLIDRLVSMHGGLHASLFIGRHGLFEPLISTENHVETVLPEQLGPVIRVVQYGQTVTHKYLPSVPPPGVCWHRASVVAAAPITSRRETIGFLILWNEERDFVFDSAFLRLLEAMSYQASILMERDRLNRKIRENDLVEKEIEIASIIQQTLLLANSPKNVTGMEIAACSLPSQHIDGDFYDFFQHPDGTLDVMVGDVMGKGVAAALLGAAAKNQILRSIANLALRSNGGPPSPVDIVRRAASRMSEQLIALERFLTMSYARFDMESKRLHLVDCGHTPTILSRTGQDCIFLQSDDLPLGVLEPYTCAEHSFEIRRGDTYLFYSDGVTENRSSDGEFFGATRLKECVENWSSLGAALLVSQIQKEAEKFRQPERFSDDFTCIAVRICISTPGQQPTASAAAAFDPEIEELQGFRTWLREIGSGAGTCLDEEGAARMELACTELFVNFAMHKRQVQFSDPIEVETLTYSDHLTIRMTHGGPEFDPLSVPPPTFDGSKDNGFGTYIVLRSADEVKYERTPSGTNVITVSFLGRNE